MIETKLGQVLVRIADHAIVGEFRTADVALARADDHDLVATRDHDVPAFRRGEIGHEQTVILARGDAGERAGGVSAEPIGHEPFLTA